MNNLVFYSFFTTDEYYTSKARELAESLGQLGVNYHFDPIEIPDGKEWPDICRKKIKLLHDFAANHPEKKVFWIDVDCDIAYIPPVIENFSADIIGFQRGFGNPLDIGYHNKTRFWTPSFFGINSTPMARKFLADAHEFEREYIGRATDDYFFEESWRANCAMMSFQFIPSVYAKLDNRESIPEIKPFFSFVSSGNVKDFSGKVDQHSVNWISKRQKPKFMNAVKSRLGLYLPQKVKKSIRFLLSKRSKISDKAFKIDALGAAKKGDGAALADLVESIGGYGALTTEKHNALRQAYAFLCYQKSGKARGTIDLAWWTNPAPGNYGDWLSPYLVHKVTEKSIHFIRPDARKTEARHYFSVGSIGKFAKSNSIIVGTGISASDAELNPESKYLSVRGPYTRSRVLELGGDCPENFGDPAVILPRVYSPKPMHQVEKLLLVRHFTHLPAELAFDANKFDEISIFASHPNEIESFVDTLHCYEGVITSAMHCYITCQAYGIPSLLVKFEGFESTVHGDGIKYLDYAEGVKVQPINPVLVANDLDYSDIKSKLHHIKISDEVIDTVYSNYKKHMST